MTAVPDRLTRLARALAVVTTRPPLATASVALQLRNPLNGGGLSTSRGARMASNARRKAERAKGRTLATRLEGGYGAVDRFVVVLTRISPKPFDDDNNAAALKSVRDGMAEAWGINDADPRVTWVTDWRQGKTHAVEAALWVVPEAPNLPWKSREEELAELGALAKHLPMCRWPDCPYEAEVNCVYCRGHEYVKASVAPSDVEVDPSDYERPLREVRVTPNVVRAKGGA